MIAGHFGFAAIVKARAPAAPLWALMLGTEWLDVVFAPLFAFGIETIVPAPGTTGGHGTGIIHADWTHSLVGALLLSALYGAFFLPRLGQRTATILAAVAFSHWVLDLVVHRGDMPILPGDFGDLPRLGFGLWRWPALSVAIELALVAAGAFLYWRAARGAVAKAGRSSTASADIAAAALFLSGLVVLALDVTGIAG